MEKGVDIEATVRKVICEKLQKKPEEVTLEARIIDDLGASSLDMFDLLTDLEEAFQIDIDDEANQIETGSGDHRVDRAGIRQRDRFDRRADGARPGRGHRAPSLQVGPEAERRRALPGGLQPGVRHA